MHFFHQIVVSLMETLELLAQVWCISLYFTYSPIVCGLDFMSREPGTSTADTPTEVSDSRGQNVDKCFDSA